MVQGEPRAKAEEGRISLDRRQDDSASRMPRSSPDVGLQANGGSASGSTLLQPRPSKEDAVPALGSGRAQEDIAVGTLTFADGSVYNGTLKHGIPDGLGTCTWKDGNKYDGEWRSGLMHGFGTFLWTSGQRYDGEWKEGQRDGVGVKVYADGSTFDGFWRDGRKHGVGVFRPPAPGPGIFGKARLGSARLAGGREDEEAEAGGDGGQQGSGAAVGAGAASPGPGQAPHPLFSSADSSVAGATLPAGKHKAFFIRKYEDGRLLREDKLTKQDIKLIFGDLPKPKKKLRKRVQKALGIGGKKLQQKQGQLLYKGMPAYDLMVRLQLGIRYSVGLSNWQQQPSGLNNNKGEPTPGDFTAKFKVFFPSSGSSKTPAHPSSDFKWKDYSPRVFRKLRLMWGVHDAEYMLSLGGSSALWQLNSPGKSGCMFFLSDDEKFLIKTTRKAEIRTLIDMLPAYYQHMRMHPGSLVTRFYGVHGVKQLHGRTVRFLVMSNIFNTELQIHRKFDLKGSTEGRTAGTQQDPNDPKSVFKDLDLDLTLRLPPATHARVMSMVQSDAEFLKRIGVMDYSLLLGVHFCARGQAAAAGGAPGPDGTARVSPAPRANSEDAGGPWPTTPSRPTPEALGVVGLSEVRDREQLRGSNQGSSVITPTPPSALQGVRLSNGGLGFSGSGAAAAAAAAVAAVGGPASTGAGPAPGPPISTLSPTLSMRLEAELTAAAVSGFRVDLLGSPGADEAGARQGQGVGLGADGGAGPDRARNFDVFSNKKEVEQRLAIIEQRMHDLNYPEQKIQDVLGLAKLKILGDTIKAGSKGQPKPSAVLKAMQQWRQEALELRPHGDPILEGGSDDDEGLDRAATLTRDDSLLHHAHWGPSGQAALLQSNASDDAVPGLAMAGVPAVAVHKTSAIKAALAREQQQSPHKGGQGAAVAAAPEAAPEEVVLYMGIIDILQDYNTRKLFERGFKSILHDSDAISVAPPKLYSQRFFNFMNSQVFQEDSPPILPRAVRRLQYSRIAEGDDGEDEDEDEE